MTVLLNVMLPPPVLARVRSPPSVIGPPEMAIAPPADWATGLAPPKVIAVPLTV